uniref:Uncharacterized protein n=1 Tax=Hemiselmis andersenii TaxID=464988 RepID=A0A6U4TQ13_HEMAN|mmetsp:Transcript_20302/g.49074  ORF Transcript_20302/g.49074 Transcript_20302/m.49074 type:complete len:155 (+) Transcript_20302:176-640(+)
MELLQLAQKNDVAGIKEKIANGVPVSEGNGVGQTPLHVACLWGNFEAAEVLLKAGADVNIRNNFSGGTPLHCAAAENDRGNGEGRRNCVAALIAVGADPEIVDFRGKKPASYSATNDIRAMLGAGPYDPYEEDDNDVPSCGGCTTVPRAWRWMA